MTKTIATAIPILPGKTEQWKKFANELNTRYKNEFNQSRKDLGVYERTFLQTTPTGDMIIVVLEGENPAEAFKKFGEKSDEFSKWFTAQVKDIHGMDLSQKNALPKMPELVVETDQIEEYVGD